MTTTTIPVSAATDDGHESAGGAVTLAAAFAYLRKWGTNGTGNGQFNTPQNVAVAADGTVYVADRLNHRIQYFTPDGTYLGQWGANGSGNGQFASPYGVAVAADGTVYVADYGNYRVQYFTSTGTYQGQWGSSGSGDGYFNSPIGVAVAADGTVYVADLNNRRIQYFSATGTFIGKFGSSGSGDGQFNTPYGVAVAADDTVYVADFGNYRVQYFSATGTYLGQWGSSGSGDGQFNAPIGVAVAADGTVYVVDLNNRRIQYFSATGTFIGKFGSSGSGDSQFNSPRGVAVAADGTVYVADTNNHRIVAWDDGLRVSSTYPTAALIFRAVPIPNADTVNVATLRVVPKRASQDIDVTVEGEGEPADLTTTTNNLTGRTPTAAAVTWTAWGSWAGYGDAVESPNLAAVIQEIVSAGGWASGDDLALILTDRATGGAAAFFGYDFDSGEYAPELFIDYGVALDGLSFAWPSDYWTVGYWIDGYWPDTDSGGGPGGTAIVVKMHHYLRQMGF